MKVGQHYKLQSSSGQLLRLIVFCSLLDKGGRKSNRIWEKVKFGPKKGEARKFRVCPDLLRNTGLVCKCAEQPTR